MTRELFTFESSVFNLNVQVRACEPRFCCCRNFWRLLCPCSALCSSETASSYAGESTRGGGGGGLCDESGSAAGVPRFGGADALLREEGRRSARGASVARVCCSICSFCTRRRCSRRVIWPRSAFAKRFIDYRKRVELAKCILSLSS